MTPILDRIRAHGGEVVRDHWTLRLRRGRLPAKALDYLQRQDVRDRLMAEVWPEFDAWDERAAIREFEGGQSRAEAEVAAYQDAMGEHSC